MMTVNFVIVGIWYRQLVRGLLEAGIDREEIAVFRIWLLQYKRTSNDVKGLLVEFYFKLFVMFLGSVAIKFISGY
tara:strand:- start:714 stop:938 length:225 start_codon:yes stop_codon:yes gene_type:complete